jgi:ribosome-binding protein aMBF1 (putative translation factor)
MIKRIEHGYIPDLHIAKKLEHVLHVKLTELVAQSEQEYVQSRGGGALTLGDVMTVKKKP